MRVLVACEYSGKVRQAFRSLGHHAYSCDLLPAEDKSPFHIQCDVREILNGWAPLEHWQIKHDKTPWDLMIAHPPCTHLAVSGARWFKEKIASGEQQKAIEFFLMLANSPIEKIAIENPICIMSTVWRKPDQIIQPWQFGHGETKSTCLWLKGLRKLQPTNIVPGRAAIVHRMSPGPDRWKNRSRTYQGIATAMAQQWSI